MYFKILTVAIASFLISSKDPCMAYTYTDEDIALELIDNICGDTWCEGDFNYIFHEVNYIKKTKTLTVSFELIADMYDTDLTFNTKCELRVNKFPEDVFLIGMHRSLTELFYENLSECVTDKEYEFRSLIESGR